MTALAKNHLNQEFETFIKEEVAMISSLNDSRIEQMMAYSKQFLDTVFPLANGSHKDVRSYVVYYQHLLAFFDDGSQTGLKDPQQFVALSGHKEYPSSIVLKNQQGYHVELIINANGKRGRKDKASIDDLQVETKQMDLGDITIAANDENMTTSWFSMVRGDSEITTTKQGHCVCKVVGKDKEFTGKDGQPYRV